MQDLGSTTDPGRDSGSGLPEPCGEELPRAGGIQLSYLTHSTRSSRASRTYAGGGPRCHTREEAPGGGRARDRKWNPWRFGQESAAPRGVERASLSSRARTSLPYRASMAPPQDPRGRSRSPPRRPPSSLQSIPKRTSARGQKRRRHALQVVKSRRGACAS